MATPPVVEWVRVTVLRFADSAVIQRMLIAPPYLLSVLPHAQCAQLDVQPSAQQDAKPALHPDAKPALHPDITQ